MIVATAGHIDHGKTLLIKTITGTDTDRLPEEKARGISIDLGFAYLPLPQGGLIGFVDVPGHERFIRNMLAGVSGIDYALLIVAADDGVMPQSVEHLHILDLLGVSRGVAVITKIDRVDTSRIEQVCGEVRALLAPTVLSEIPILPVSSLTGSGLDELKALLLREAAAQVERQRTGQYLRFAIDRTFTIAGSGTVVTGTVFNGRVSAGDRLLISPAGHEVRVRGIQINGKPTKMADAGERCALNLSGASLDLVRRGDWVMAEPIHHPTRRLDVQLTVLPGRGRPLKHWTPVHFHLATADITARVSLRGGVAINPGSNGIGQLVLDAPVCALHGDRFILRDQSCTITIGGGRILDPLPPARRRNKDRGEILAALEMPDYLASLSLLAENDGNPVDLAHFEAIFNLSPKVAASAYFQSNLVPLGKVKRIAIKKSRLNDLHQAILKEVEDFHRSQPDSSGIATEALHQLISPQLNEDAFEFLLRMLAEERRIEIHGSLVHKPGYDPTSNNTDTQLWRVVLPALVASGFNAPLLSELAVTLKMQEVSLRDLLYRQMKAGNVYRVGRERFYPKATMATLAEFAKTTAARQTNGFFTPAQYRDALGIGRSLAMEILDVLDRLAITQRIGDARKMRKDYVSVFGAAAPPLSATKSQQVGSTMPSHQLASKDTN